MNREHGTTHIGHCDGYMWVKTKKDLKRVKNKKKNLTSNWQSLTIKQTYLDYKVKAGLSPCLGCEKVPSCHMPHFCRWDLLRRFNAYFWVPFTRGQNDDLIQELIDARNQVLTVPGSVGNIAEQLRGKEEKNSN